jgi:hypothetical protein
VCDDLVFFGIGDGKGAHDGAKVVMKQFLRQGQLNAHGVLKKYSRCDKLLTC